MGKVANLRLLDIYLEYPFPCLKILLFFRSFSSLPYSVKFILEVENFAISPGEKHGVMGHKTDNMATGCAGEVR